MDVGFCVSPNWEGRSEPHTVGSILGGSHFIFIPLLGRPNIQVERSQRMVPPYSSTGQTCPLTWLSVSPVLALSSICILMYALSHKNFAALNVSV